jgi:hypothetical protein
MTNSVKVSFNETLQQLGFKKVNECFGYEHYFTNSEYYLLERGKREFLIIVGKDCTSFIANNNQNQTDHIDFSSVDEAIEFYKEFIK